MSPSAVLDDADRCYGYTGLTKPAQSVVRRLCLDTSLGISISSCNSAKTTTNLAAMTMHTYVVLCCAVLSCVQNEEAEELMRHVEQEEEEAAASNPEGLQLHLCIINLVIGTLYCSKVGLAAWVAHC